LALIHRDCHAGSDSAWASGKHADQASAQALSRAVQTGLGLAALRE